MFFRHEKPKVSTYQERLEALRSQGFTVESRPGGGSRVSRNGCAAIVEDRGEPSPHVHRAGILIGGEIGQMVNEGYQMFFSTQGGQKQPALAEQLRTLHAFEEDLTEALGLTSLYNQSLGTTADKHLYDRIVSRDKGVPERPWEGKKLVAK